MPNETNFSASTAGARVNGTLRDSLPVIPNVPPMGLQTIGPRVTFNFAGLWDAESNYEYYDVVRDAAGASYIGRVTRIPAGTPLTDETYWIPWADPNAQFDELNNLVQTFDGRITAVENASETLSGDFETLNNVVQPLDGRITAVENTSETLSGDFETLTTEMPYKISSNAHAIDNGTIQAIYAVAKTYMDHNNELVFTHHYEGHNAWDYDSGPSSVVVGTKTGWSINCSSFVHLVITGTPYMDSMYNRENGNTNRFGRGGYLFNMYGEPVTLNNYAEYMFARNMAQRLYEMGMLERCNSDMSNIRPGDLVFLAENENAPFSEIIHVMISLSAQYTPFTQTSTQPYMLFAEVAESEPPVKIRARTCAQMRTARYVAHIPYQSVPMRNTGLLANTPIINNSYTAGINGVVSGDVITLEFDHIPAGVGDYVKVYLDNHSLNPDPVRFATMCLNSAQVGSKYHYTLPIPTNVSNANPGSAISNIIIRPFNTNNKASGMVENLRVTTGFGINSSALDYIRVADLTDFENKLKSMYPLQASSFVKSDTFYIVSDSQINAGNITISADTPVLVKAIAYATTSNVKIEADLICPTGKANGSYNTTSNTWSWV